MGYRDYDEAWWRFHDKACDVRRVGVGATIGPMDPLGGFYGTLTKESAVKEARRLFNMWGGRLEVRRHSTQELLYVFCGPDRLAMK